ncbi:MAG: tripartite tricarboxylate transporter permease [Fusobacteriaceae bacterium]|jgi:hypothetical protein|nr:tripartite tricarboxylate transporter permease [Fusobacteriaceae bacterium]
MSTILLAIAISLVGGIIFSIIGVIPGTDETATMAPLTLVLVLIGVPPTVVFAWFIAILIAMQITHTVPTAMAALPGSTMAVPMVANSNIAKRLGIPHIAMRKMAAGSLIGSIIAFPIAIIVAGALAPLGKVVAAYSGLIFTLGAIIIAYVSKAKWGAIISLLPFAFLIQGLQRISVETTGKTLFISIFMGITIGPMIAELFNVMIPMRRELQKRDKPKVIWLAPESKNVKGSIFPNPFSFFGKSQVGYIAGASAVSACTFTFSPVGMTVLMGELIAARKKELYDRITATLGVQDAVSNATYLGELLIPMVAFGLPLSPVALGPASPLFNQINLHDYLSISQYFIYGIIGMVGGCFFAYPLSIKKARSWTEAMFRYVSHEALIGAFMGLICMLAFYEAGIFGIFVAVFVGIFGGILNNLFGIHTGVQFMGYYASGYIVTQVIALCKFIN